ncbi:molybdenum cofactor guanylyltransferase [Aurantiacibacter sediminis]|uniref:Molybdenum cofactor guanylyltransferase n=1 Tax=Aurantiacibacter sediminis TaxID=2793064 RepID=A0ABS0N6N5_9SPHN|nr:molybdenum cofactor guanylyltransferase [Aurantiacibacter sediminis]MBH5323460.1 molybdenum cofactor guanylyltransferase [Aurantiacibacter sediminis]
MSEAPFVLILAGGAASRMGGVKPSRKWGSGTLLNHVVSLARRWSHDPVVAVRRERDDGTPDCRTVDDRRDVDGPLAGLAAGLDEAIACSKTRLLLLPCDMPFLPIDLPDRLAAALEAQSAASCAIARSGSDSHYDCSLWSVAALREVLPSYLQAGHRSLQRLSAKLGGVAVQWAVGHRDPFLNVNELGALERARQMQDDAQ